MSIALGPIHTLEYVQNGWTIGKKIEMFIARVEGWQLGVAREMVEKNVPHRGFALLLIVTSYFEMLAKYRESFVGDRNSEEHFEKGVRFTFPDIEKDLPNADTVLHMLYTDVRNAFYHLGRTTGRVLITGEVPFVFGYNVSTGQIAMNPDQLVMNLKTRFSEYASKLRDPSRTEMRMNFEKRFDFDDK